MRPDRFFRIRSDAISQIIAGYWISGVEPACVLYRARQASVSSTTREFLQQTSNIMYTFLSLHCTTMSGIMPRRCRSVAGGLRVLGRRKANTRVGRVEDGVETLEERVPVDEVEALAGVAADIAHDEVDVVGGAADRAIQRARPDLGVRREAVARLRNTQMSAGRGGWRRGDERTPPMLKLSVWSWSYCELEILRRPVELSSVPPVADLYLLYASGLWR